VGPPNSIRINIASVGRPLLRVTYGAGETKLESGLSDATATKAIAEAMLRIAQNARRDNSARMVTDTFLAHSVHVREYAEALGRMCMQMYAPAIAQGMQEIHVDLEAWSMATSASSPSAN
jgi:hypothetical protein